MVSSRRSRSSGLIRTAAGWPLRVTTTRSCWRATRSTSSGKRGFTVAKGRISDTTMIAVKAPPRSSPASLLPGRLTGYARAAAAGSLGAPRSAERLSMKDAIRPGGSVSPQPEDKQERVIDRSELVVAEVGDVIAEMAGIDRAGHLSQHAGTVAVKLDLRVEACRRSAVRGRADDDGREGQQVVGLDDHSEPAAVLDASASSWQRDRVDVTANHAIAPSARRPQELLSRRRRQPSAGALRPPARPGVVRAQQSPRSLDARLRRGRSRADGRSHRARSGRRVQGEARAAALLLPSTSL